MRILVISPSYPPADTGEAEHCYQIAARLAKAGHHVSVLSNVHPAPITADCFELHAVMTGWKWRDALGLMSQIRQLRPDAVMLIYSGWIFDDHPMITYLPSALKRLMPETPLLSMIEVNDGSRPGSWAVRTGRKVASCAVGSRGVDFCFGTLLRDSHAVFVLGPNILSSLLARCDTLAPRAQILPPPPLINAPHDSSPSVRAAARERLGVKPEEFLFAFFGFVLLGKGVDTLLPAIKELAARGRSVKLVMAGGGRGEKTTVAHGDGAAYEATMMALAKELGVDHLVVWPAGYSSGSEAPALDLLAADAAVLPFDDGAELRRSSIAVVTEIGLPLVTTTPSSNETAFVDGQNVLMFPARDVQGLVRAAGRMMDEHELREQLQKGSCLLSSSYFSWDVSMAKINTALPTR